MVLQVTSSLVKAMKKLLILMLCLIITFLLLSCGDYNSSTARTDTVETENVIDNWNTEKVESEDKTTEESTKQPYNGIWHMSEWKKYPQQKEKAQYYDETNALYIKVPVVYEENVEGLIIKVEFFQDIYTLHSYIQCRVTITNTLDKWIEFNGKAEATPGVFNRNGTKFFNKVYYAKNFDSIAHSNVLSVYLNNGESFVNETVFYMSDTFFIEGYDYSFIVQVTTHDKEGKSENFECRIPIELCNPIEA